MLFNIEYLKKSASIVTIPEPLYYYQWHDNGSLTSKYYDTIFYDLEQIYHAVSMFCNNNASVHGKCADILWRYYKYCVLITCDKSELSEKKINDTLRKWDKSPVVNYIYENITCKDPYIRIIRSLDYRKIMQFHKRERWIVDIKKWIKRKIFRWLKY